MKSHCHTYNTATPIALTIAMLKDTMCGQSDDRNWIHGKDVFIVSTAKLSEILNSVDCSILATLSHLAIGRKSNFVVRIPPPAIIHWIVCLLEVLWQFEITLCCRRLKNDVLRSYTCFQYRFGGFLKYFLPIAFVPKRQNLVALKYKAIFFYSNSVRFTVGCFCLLFNISWCLSSCWLVEQLTGRHFIGCLSQQDKITKWRSTWSVHRTIC